MKNNNSPGDSPDASQQWVDEWHWEVPPFPRPPGVCFHRPGTGHSLQEPVKDLEDYRTAQDIQSRMLLDFIQPCVHPPHSLFCVSPLSDSESLLCCFLADLNFLCPFQKNPHELHSNSWTRPCLFFLLVTDDSRPYTSINTLYLFSTFLPLPPRAGACHRCGICHSTCLLNTDWLMMNGSVGELQPGMTTVSLSLQLFVSISLYSTMQQNAPCM